MVVFCTASSASAANFAPNPGFENACGPATKACSWVEVLNNTNVELRRDDSVGHDSGASYLVKLVGAFFGAGGRSDCMTPPPTTPGPVSMSFWYRTTDARISDIEMYGWFWDTATCTGSASGSLLRASAPMRDGEWHQVTGSSTALSGQSFHVEVGFSCSSSCAGAQVHFDDVVYAQSDPTAVQVASLSGSRTGSGVRLRWRTVRASSFVGFHVFREQHGKLTRLNQALIPGIFGRGSGHAYSWLDRTAPSGAPLRYRLQAVSLNGERSWVGSVTVS